MYVYCMMYLFTTKLLLVLTVLTTEGWPDRFDLGGWLYTEMV